MIVRVVVRGKPPGDLGASEAMLVDAVQRWPRGRRAKFLLTPGGFAEGTIPRSWSPRGTGWRSTPHNLGPLLTTAEQALKGVVTPSVRSALRGKVEVLTVGIDLYASKTHDHVELVAIYDIACGRLVRWTGKSYPTSAQERTLFQVVDLRSHLLEIANERALILGCHDLNMWSPRGWANQNRRSARRKRCAEMRKLASEFDPTIVLQHPHSTDTANIWALPWGEIRRQLPNVRAWASGVGYFAWNGPPRAPLDSVLERTKSRGCVDIIVDARNYG